MKLLLLMTSALFLLSCAGKSEGNVVYLEEGDRGFGLKKVKEVCEEDVDGEVCREIYVKPVPVVKESLYEKEKKETLLKLIKKPPAPVRTPDEVLKIYVLPYTDSEGNFHGGEYLFVVVGDGKWLMGDRVEGEEERKVLTPLKKEEKDEGR